MLVEAADWVVSAKQCLISFCWILLEAQAHPTTSTSAVGSCSKGSGRNQGFLGCSKGSHEDTFCV